MGSKGELKKALSNFPIKGGEAWEVGGGHSWI